MPLSERHRGKVKRYLDRIGTARTQYDLGNAPVTFDWVFDRMTLLNDETALDTALVPLDAAHKSSELGRLNTEKVRIQQEIDDLGAP